MHQHDRVTSSFNRFTTFGNETPSIPGYVKKQVLKKQAGSYFVISGLERKHGIWTNIVDLDGRVAEVFEGLTFVTVIGAGHEVLLSKPHAAFELFKYFLRGKPLPK